MAANLSQSPIRNTSSIEDGIIQSVTRHEYTHQAGVRILLLCGLLLVSLTGNIVALYTLMVGKGGLAKRRSKTIFLHITLADMLVTLFPMLGQVIWEIVEREWVAGGFFCKVFKFIQTYALASSNYMLVALAMDRHRAVTKPLMISRSPNRLVSSAWLTSLLPSLPCLFIFEITIKIVGEDSVREECVSNFTGWSKMMKKSYFTGIFLVIFVIPLCVMFSLYTHMLMQLRDNTRNTHRIKMMEMGDLKQKESSLRYQSSRTSMRVNLPEGRDGKYLSRAKEKITNLTLTVVTIFIITNLPYMVDEFIRQEILADSWCSMSWCGAVEAIIGVSIVSNSAINPFIFLLFNSSSPTATSLATSCCPCTWTRQDRASILRVGFRNKRLFEEEPKTTESTF